MARYVALLRAVNVGGTGKLPMASLRGALEDQGFGQVRTLLASGNAVFEAPKTARLKIERQVERVLAANLDVETDVIVRNRDEWASLIAANPFPGEAANAPAKLGLLVMKAGVDPTKLETYLNAYSGPEKVLAGDGCVYLFYPDGMGRTKLNIGGKAGTGTVRNWNTVLKIAALLGLD